MPERHAVSDRVTFLQSDLLAAIEGADFDAVVSNPPYVAEAEVLEPQVANYEPHSALYAGPTGLEIYERLIPQAGKRLKPQRLADARDGLWTAGSRGSAAQRFESAGARSALFPTCRESHEWFRRRKSHCQTDLTMEIRGIYGHDNGASENISDL